MSALCAPRVSTIFADVRDGELIVWQNSNGTYIEWVTVDVESVDRDDIDDALAYVGFYADWSTVEESDRYSVSSLAMRVEVLMASAGV